MKKNTILTSLACLCLPLASSAYSTNNVIEVYNDCAPSSCCSNSISFAGLYLAINGGYSWFDFNLHRPAFDQFLLPLSDGAVDTHDWSLVPAIGYDFYPGSHIPLRFEISYLYTDQKYSLNPLFVNVDDVAPNLSADDSFRIHNTMLSVYIDWRNCSRFIPFIGASYGWADKRTRHSPVLTGVPDAPGTFPDKDDSAAWGGTLGTRFMLTCHVYGNVQLRYDAFQELRFKNTTAGVDLPEHDDYLSDYLHATTLLVGLGFEY